MLLRQVFNPKAINIHLLSEDKDEVFEELIEELVNVDPSLNRVAILDAVQEREAKMTTGIMPGIAVPHGKTKAVSGIKGVIGISKNGIQYESLDNKPVHVVFMLVYSPDGCEKHLEVLKIVAKILEDPSFYQSLLTVETSEAAYDLVCKYESKLFTKM
jgi:PTS system fructose-specific IIC component/PTS system nitrogen regulatory IIA component